MNHTLFNQTKVLLSKSITNRNSDYAAHYKRESKWQSGSKTIRALEETNIQTNLKAIHQVFESAMEQEKTQTSCCHYHSIKTGPLMLWISFSKDFTRIETCLDVRQSKGGRHQIPHFYHRI